MQKSNSPHTQMNDLIPFNGITIFMKPHAIGTTPFTIFLKEALYTWAFAVHLSIAHMKAIRFTEKYHLYVYEITSL
ncbi:hypothetical protein [Bartonella vinsonii]|nr:hypothetical protein [Bartonella vinsonii]